jgi:hypothetical protein
MKLQARIGLSVITVGIVNSNGAREHAAVVTRVWSDTTINGEQCTTVNLTIFPDLMTPQLLGSQCLFRTKGEAERSGCSAYAYITE